MKRFLIALQLLTRLPLPQVRAEAADFAASMRWFPLAGGVVGMAMAVPALPLAPVDGWVAALAALFVWVGITGALHLDGLADISDAAGAAHKGRERIEAVLADPHVGSFGLVAVTLQLLAKLVLLHAVLARGAGWQIGLVPAVARMAPLVWSRWLPPLHQGLGTRFGGAVGAGTLGMWAVLLLFACTVSPGLAIAPLLFFLWGYRLRRTIGGISGDGHGAGIELVETGLLAAIFARQVL